MIPGLSLDTQPADDMNVSLAEEAEARAALSDHPDDCTAAAWELLLRRLGAGPGSQVNPSKNAHSLRTR